MLPNNDKAMVTIDGGTNVHYDGAGSIKGSIDMPELLVKNAVNNNAESMYFEQARISPGILVPGAMVYSITQAPLSSGGSSVLVDVRNTFWQNYWTDSCSNANVPFNWTLGVIIPPDYNPTSSAPSSLGGGILQNSLENFNMGLFCGGATPQATLVTRGVDGTTALNWPTGALIGEVDTAGQSLALPHAHIDAVAAPVLPGYDLRCNNSTTATCAEAVVGSIPDHRLIQSNCTAPASVLYLDADQSFNDGTLGFTIAPTVGLFVGHTSSIFSITGTDSESISQYDYNSAFTSVYDNTGFIYGPSALQAAQYATQPACMVVLDPQNNRTVSSAQNIETQHIAPMNTVTGLSELGLSYSRNYYAYGKQATFPQPTSTPSTSGGSIPAWDWEIVTAPVLSTAFPPNGYTGTYPNSTISVPGLGYSLGPTVTIAGAASDTRTISTLAFSTSGLTVTACFVPGTPSLPATWIVGAQVTLSGMSANAASEMLAGSPTIITSVSAPCFTGTNRGVASSQSATSDTGVGTISYCPYFYTKASTGAGGAITGMGGTSAGTQGYCTVAPGFNANLAITPNGSTFTGTPAAGSLIVQGSYGLVSQKELVTTTNGTANSGSNSITVTLPTSYVETSASGVNLYAGPPGLPYFIGFFPFSAGTTTITSLTNTPSAAGGQSFAPKDCAAFCVPDSAIGAYDYSQMGGSTGFIAQKTVADFTQLHGAIPFSSVPFFSVDYTNGTTLYGPNGTLLNGFLQQTGGIVSAVAGPFLTGTTSTIAGTALTATCDSGTATVAGAGVGSPVSVSSTTGADVGGAFNLRASVTSTNTVTVYVCGTGTPASLAYNVAVF